MTRTHSLLSLRFTLVALAAAALVGLALAAALSTNEGARADGHVTGSEAIVLSHTEVNFVPGTSRSPEEVWIYGSGFTPGIEISLALGDSRGVLTVISDCQLTDDGVCNPATRRDGGGSVAPLIANDDGAFATNWRIGRFTRNGVGGEKMVTMWAVDASTYDFLASAPIALCNLGRNDNLEEGADPAPVPSHCSS